MLFLALLGVGPGLGSSIAAAQEGGALPPTLPDQGAEDSMDIAAPLGGAMEGAAPAAGQGPEVDLTPAMDVDTSFSFGPTKSTGGLNMGMTARPRTYEVVRGDTLWDISARFWGDPYFWPTLWSYNPTIGNAHFIYPGDLLRFTLGSPVRPPGLALEGQGQPPLAAQDTGAGGAPVAPSQTYYNTGMEVTGGGVSNELLCAPPVAFRSDPPGANVHSNLYGFMREDEQRSIGRLVRSPEEANYLADRSTVYLSFSRLSDVECGDVYTLYRPLATKVRHPERRLRKLGNIYEITGEVRVVDKNDHVATAEIIHAYSEVERGDLITEFMPVRKDVSIRAASKDLDGYIIGSMRDPRESLSVRDIVYIDRGDEDGLADGDAFYIVRHGDGVTMHSRKDSVLPSNVVGKLVILQTGDSVSAAIVTEAVDALMVGDRISMQIY